MYLSVKEDSKERTINIKKNISWNLILKAVSLLISFMLLPMTIHYLSVVEYGVWITLFTVMNWINLMDVGIGLGIRNKLAEAVSKEDINGIRAYISIGCVSAIIMGVGFWGVFYYGIQFIDFQKVFNTNMISNSDLYQATLYAGIFIIITFVFSIINQFYYAFQKAAFVGLMQIIHGLIMLTIVYFLTLQNEHKMIYFIFSFGVATIISKVGFFGYFFIQQRNIFPKVKYIETKKVKEVLCLGTRFFVLQLATVVIFSSSSMFITGFLGPEYVQSYDVIFRIFNVIPVLHSLAVTPLWSAYTDAYTKKDFIWIKKILKKLNLLMIPIIILAFIIGMNIDFIIIMWIGIKIDYSIQLLFLMGLYAVTFTWSNNYAYLLNGISKLSVQLVGWTVSAFMILPLNIMFLKILNMEAEGVILSIICCLLINGIIAPIYTYKILNTNS